MKIYMVRHGETDWNSSRKLQGQVDIPLNEFGRKLAVKTATGFKDVKFDVCYTSPLSRAKETAEIILDGIPNGKEVPVTEDDRIMEMSFGIYEGKLFSRGESDIPDQFFEDFNHPDIYLPPEGGESFGSIMERTGAFLKELFEKEELKDSTVLITTHGVAVLGLINNITKTPLSGFWRKGVHKNCAVTEVDVKDGIPTLVSENVVYYDDEVADWYVFK